jgi:hypothetical protein
MIYYLVKTHVSLYQRFSNGYILPLFMVKMMNCQLVPFNMSNFRLSQLEMEGH